MTALPPLLVKSPAVVYPESDGKPMADNSKQFRWIHVLFANLAALFDSARDVLVGGNMFWYPVEGEPEVVNAPDVFVVFGRPKGDRGSYKQWEEAGVPMTVVFEVLSPGNTAQEMDDKFEFYEEHGVEEYYVYDPDRNRLKGFVRQGEVLRRVRPIDNHLSPRLSIRFDLSGSEMAVFRPDGERFLTFEELRERFAAERARADSAEQQAADAKQQAADAKQEAADAKRQAADARKKADELAARLRALGIDPET